MTHGRCDALPRPTDRAACGRGGGRNRARFPATHRIDVDVSRDFRIRKVLASTYVSVANAYNARNVFVYLYQYSTDPPTRRAISQFPVLPSAGVRLAF